MIKRSLVWPLPDVAPASIPSVGAFGARRRYDVHTGVDLHAPEGSCVVAIEAGRVVAVCDFTGPAAGCPWWLPTRAVMIEGESGVILYGEIDSKLFAGLDVAPGTPIGRVKRVLRNDKGRPTSMLHLELYVTGTRAPVEVWSLESESPPDGLRDPTDLVREHIDRARTPAPDWDDMPPGGAGGGVGAIHRARVRREEAAGKRRSEVALRRDYFEAVEIDLATQEMKRLPSSNHVLCGTCVGEHDRWTGFFESYERRKAVGDVTKVRADNMKKFCCNCGQLSYVEAIFTQEPGKGPCDGIHEIPQEDV